MRIEIRTLRGETIHVEGVHMGTTVRELKKKVEEETGIREDEIRFIYGGRGMEDQRTLEDYDFNNSRHICMVLRLCCRCWNLELRRYEIPKLSKRLPNWKVELREKVFEKVDSSQLNIFRVEKENMKIVLDIQKCFQYWHPNLVSLECESLKGPINSFLRTWKFTLIGPKGSPYQDGHFEFRLIFSQQHPMHPYRLELLTKMFHPISRLYGGVRSTCRDNEKCKYYPPGGLCHLIDRSGWSPVYTPLDLIDVLVFQMTNFWEIYQEKKFEFPENCEALRLLQQNEVEEYRMIAREYTLKYAMGRGRDVDEKERIGFVLGNVANFSIVFTERFVERGENLVGLIKFEIRIIFLL